MSASRDDNSQNWQTPEVSEQQHLSEVDQSAQQYDADYVPEREFVLMPLFRRIGQLLGIGQHQEPEYVYEPEPAPSIERQVAEREPEASVQQLQPSVQESPVVQPASAMVAPEPAAEDVLGLESAEAVQPFAAERDVEPESLQPQYEAATPWSQVDERLEESSKTDIEEIRPESVAYTERPQLELVHSQSNTQQSTDLTAPLREAAMKISAAISQAAEWLHRKEEEILKRAELPQSAAGQSLDGGGVPAIDFQQRIEPVPDLPLEAHTLIASTPAVIPTLEPAPARPEISDETGLQRLDAPALQREVAWHPRRLEPVQVDSVNTSRESTAGERKPRLVPAPVRVPFWNRVDWAREFTPKRVAVLGGLAMAVMMVLGISFARRPASSILPPQQQARTHEPGGVTLTTHPASPAKTSPQSMHRAPASANAAAAPAARRSNREPEYSDGPDVVTHYYNTKQKPSAAKQSTVAGVRHYSDM